MNKSNFALVNVDLQNCFVEDSPIAAPGGRDILEKINRISAACRKAGALVIHVSHVVRTDGSNMGVLARSPAVRGGIINKGCASAALHDALVIEDGDILLDKPRFGAFHGTDLELILRARGIDTVIVTGIATNVCCETTAREAAVRDFKVIFISDATATFAIGTISAEDIQRVSCATIGLLFGDVLTTDALLDMLR